MATEARNISDAELYAYAERAEGQVVIITGGATGIGKAGALEFASRGAKVVVGDIDIKGGQHTVQEIREAGGIAIFQTCDVTKWEELVSLFKTAVSDFGSVDVVIANAGINEAGRFMSVAVDDNDDPKPPNLRTIEINLISVLNTSHLAIHYFCRNKKENSLKALVITGSIASFTPLSAAPMYTSSKHALLGFMKGLRAQCMVYGFRIAMVTPWFVDTGLLTTANQLVTAGLPKTPISRVAGAIFLAATDEDSHTNGAVYCLPDEREVFRIPHTELGEGIYKLLNKRAERIFNFATSLRIYIGIFKIIIGLRGTRLLGLLILCFAGSQMAVTKGWV